VEKGNGAEPGAGTPVGEAEESSQSGAGETREREKPAPTGDETRARDPWSGVPDLGETTLPGGSTLRRDGDGRFWRPDENGEDSVWDPESGRWMRPTDWREAPGSEDWGDPNPEWDEAWGAGSTPEGWQDAPRSGTTKIAEGTLRRDSSGNYELGTPDGTLKWNEQTGKWYDAGSGRAVPNPLDPVEGWQRGAQTDAYHEAHPDQPHPFRGDRPPSGKGFTRP
jgi:hypothetical protein